MSKTQPLISVLIPTFNEERVILASLNQFHELPGNWQLIVSDGGSQDGTQEQLKRFGGEVKCLKTTARYRAEAIQAGLKHCKGEAVVILHADCILPKSAHQSIVNCLNNASAGAFRTHTFQDKSYGFLMRFLLKLADIRSRYTGLPYGDQALFFRQEALKKTRGYPDNVFMDDWEFAKMMSKKVGKIKILRETVRVSGRRMENAPIKYFIIINFFPMLYRMGLSPEFLLKHYQPER